MKKNNLYSILRAGAFMTALMTFAGMLQSCEEDEPSAPTSFAIEGNPTGITSGVAGKTESFVVRASGDWQIVASEEANWVKVFPDEGKDDGIIKITVSPNDGFDERVVNLAFVVNGEEQPVLFRIEQDANVPYITLPESVTIPSRGGDISIDVTSNVTWNYTISDDAWLSPVSQTADKITLAATVNNGAERSVELTVTSTEIPGLSETVTLVQQGGSIVLFERFDWLSYGSAVPYVTSGETKISSWTEDQLAKGWTSTMNPLSGDQPLYARQGFVKLGKTNYGGDLISPKLSTIDGTRNLKVTFKAAAYISAGGALDSRELVIEILGAGTPSTTLIMIENIPNDEDEDKAGIENNIWADDRAFSFDITGATAETQIRFLGKAFDLTAASPNKNRIFIDDIKAEVVE